MPALKELTQQQIRWEQFKSTVRKDVLDNAKFPSPEGYSIKFYLSLQFLQQEEGLPLPDLLTQQTLQLAESQANWSGVPLRRDISVEEKDAISEKVRSDTEALERTKQAKADSDNYVTVNYPKLIEGVMESIRLRGHTKLPEEAIALLHRSEQEEPVELGNTLIKAFDVLFGQSETPVPSLPAPVQVMYPVEVREPEVVVKEENAAVGEEPGSDERLHWKDLGIDATTPEYQMYNEALKKLAKELTRLYPVDFPPTPRTLRFVEKLKKFNDNEALFVIFNDTFQGPGTEKSVARLLNLIDCKEGEVVGDWRRFIEHAKAIKNGTAKTLLPEVPGNESSIALEISQIQELPIETSSQAEPRTDRFPQTDEEITTYIDGVLKRMDSRLKEDRTLGFWPKNHTQMCRLAGKKLSMDIVDNAIHDGLVTPYMIDDDVPMHSQLNYVKIMAIHEFKQHGLSSQRLHKTLERFDIIFQANFGKR